MLERDKRPVSQKQSGLSEEYCRLPEGQIEFEESSEEALEKEFVREVRIKPSRDKLITVFSHTEETPHLYFHQVSIVFRISSLHSLRRKNPNFLAQRLAEHRDSISSSLSVKRV